MLNKAILVGRLTSDPELRTTPNSIPVATFRIAIDRAFSSKSGERQADFINIVAWRTTAEFVCKYFQKGSAIGIDGSIQTREYTDKEGNKRTAFEVVADKVSFVERKGDNPSTPARSTSAFKPDVAAEDDFSSIDDQTDLPF